MVNGRLLLLLQFSAANFFPISVLALLLPSSLDFRLLTKGSGGAWKNLWRSVWVLCADVVQDWEGGTGSTGFKTIFNGADSTEEGRGDRWV